MSTEAALWIAIGFIVLQATFMSWATTSSHKSFMAMSEQIDRLISMLHEILDDDALLAQRIEHEPSKLGVEGSNPSERTTSIPSQHQHNEAT